MEPIISSFIFFTNVITTYLYKKYYIYSYLFATLTATSLLFHSNPNIYTNIIDKCAIVAIVLYGGLMLYNKITIDNLHKVILIIASFISVLVLFFYGYYNKKYCYDINYSNHYHCLLHFISSVGHHFIIFL
jgi:hypothetical protein